MGRQPAVGARGFTLLELVVTLMVLALAIGLVMPAIGRSTEAIRARAEVARFAALLRHTRERAITTRRAHSLVVEPRAHRVRIVAVADEGGETHALSERLSVEADPPAALSVRFEPYGTSTGGRFHLASGRVRYRVTVDALTGRVRAEHE